MNGGAPTGRVSITQLTPLIFLERSASVYPDKPAIRYHDRVQTYAEMKAEVNRLAQGLKAAGIEPGDRVAYLLPNIPEMLIAHFGVPLAGAGLVAINTRLSGAEVEYILQHSGASILVVDTGLYPVVEPNLANCPGLTVIVLHDPHSDASPVSDHRTYQQLLDSGNDDPLPFVVEDEESMISINYTSGTTGRPKGVMYTHRGAHLNAFGELLHSRHNSDSIYLWTLPMFHCNGWCTTWGIVAIGGTSICLRAVDPARVWQLIEAEKVTHLNAAPTVLISLANHDSAFRVDWPLTITTAGAPPSPTIISEITKLGADMVHMYGLTETYGPYTVCEPQTAWNDQPDEVRYRLLARQGVSFIGADPIRVVDLEMNDVPRDGATMGEVAMRGNNVMAGYFADPDATTKAFEGGWFHSGDLAVWHPDGYIELRDRQKDIIISGGENISTIEVEQAIASHPAVLEVAVIAIPHEHWGERPKAFVLLKPGSMAEPSELIEHVRNRLAHFKAPDIVEIVESLPKTSTGKIQKFVLREMEWSGATKRIN